MQVFFYNQNKVLFSDAKRHGEGTMKVFIRPTNLNKSTRHASMDDLHARRASDLVRRMTQAGVRTGKRVDNDEVAFPPVDIVQFYTETSKYRAGNHFDLIKLRIGKEIEDMCKPTTYIRISDGTSYIEDGMTIKGAMFLIDYIMQDGFNEGGMIARAEEDIDDKLSAYIVKKHKKDKYDESRDRNTLFKFLMTERDLAIKERYVAIEERELNVKMKKAKYQNGPFPVSYENFRDPDNDSDDGKTEDNDANDGVQQVPAERAAAAVENDNV